MKFLQFLLISAEPDLKQCLFLCYNSQHLCIYMFKLNNIDKKEHLNLTLDDYFNCIFLFVLLVFLGQFFGECSGVKSFPPP